ncbi:helix-turn-helix transcriptional regulator [Solwaraspora sp. WMMD1047]|uniref:helix-turn-helix transcriptional regulator n=1 Tax=Solwaraspora sp. WMMD1047 TaxID=3016102 RepID=UPI002416A5A0|nr:helix-turn-helix transcriptional regulator [Solwaraspora sp. WMMD1047]MDG4831864.1 helix-turn-helix transcriptional regulator [Solwaraspora sp. WMMD1047]
MTTRTSPARPDGSAPPGRGRPAMPASCNRPPVALSTLAAVDALLATAGHDVLLTRTLRTGLDESAAMLRHIDPGKLRRGVRYRVLFPDRARCVPTLAARLTELSAAGAEIRTVDEVPIDATVVDATFSVLPGGGRDGGPAGGVAIFRLPSVAATVGELFDRVWPAAVPLRAAPAPRGPGLSARERELLGLLSAGWTDESAAARLGISVRTVRRMMSDIMNRLGARSRFQAGVKAVDRGWLTDQVD